MLCIHMNIRDCPTSDKLNKAENRFHESIDLHLAKARVFYKDNAHLILLKRSGLNRLPSSKEMWSIFSAEISRILIEKPEHFIKHCEFPFINALLSIKTLKGELEANGECRKIVWISESQFIHMGAKTWLQGHPIDICCLSDIRAVGSTASDTYQQYHIRELVLSLVDIFDYDNLTFMGDWKAPLKIRAERKLVNKAKYLKFIQKVFTARQLSKAYNEDIIIGDAKRLNLKLWEKIVRKSCVIAFTEKGANNHNEARALLFDLIVSGDSLARLIGGNIWNEIESMGRSFSITQSEIIDNLRSAAEKEGDYLSLDNAVYSRPANEIKKDMQRINRMDLSRKTKLIYDDLFIIDGIMKCVDERHRGIYDLHISMNALGINHSIIRGIMKNLFNVTLWNKGLTNDMHDMVYDIIPAIMKFTGRMPYAGNNSGLFNKVFRLIESELAGGGFRSNSLDQLSIVANNLDKIEPGDFQSLNSLAAILLRNDKTLINAIERAVKHGFVVDLERDKNIAVGMRLTNLLDTYMKSNEIELAPQQHSEIRDELGELKIATLPHDHLLGVMGAGVSGVCIQFTSRYHFEHLAPRCRNLIVHDSEQIFLWGLLVESDEGSFYMNNFQGSLPSRYKKDSLELCEAVQAHLSRIGDVYIDNFYFNAVSLCEGLELEKNVKLTLPLMRLDLEQNKKGRLYQTNLYKVNASKSCKANLETTDFSEYTVCT